MLFACDWSYRASILLKKHGKLKTQMDKLNLLNPTKMIINVLMQCHIRRSKILFLGLERKVKAHPTLSPFSHKGSSSIGSYHPFLREWVGPST